MRERVSQAETDQGADHTAGSLPRALSRCDHCGGLFEPTRAWSAYCHDDCRRGHERLARAIGSQILEHSNGAARASRLVVEIQPGGISTVTTETKAELPLDTRRAARDAIEAGGRCRYLREKVISALETYGAKTADETAEILRESPLAIRPRFSELNQAGAIVDTGERRKNRSGNTAKVWKVAP